MTLEEYLEKTKDSRWYGEQDENGVDLSLIRTNLALSSETNFIVIGGPAEALMGSPRVTYGP